MTQAERIQQALYVLEMERREVGWSRRLVLGVAQRILLGRKEQVGQ